jgi:hypothetical protein
VKNVKINFDRFSVSPLKTCSHPRGGDCTCCTVLAFCIQKIQLFFSLLSINSTVHIREAILVTRSYILGYHKNLNSVKMLKIKPDLYASFLKSEYNTEILRSCVHLSVRMSCIRSNEWFTINSEIVSLRYFVLY